MRCALSLIYFLYEADTMSNHHKAIGITTGCWLVSSVDALKVETK
jgi:predicted cupin superfamily sugar epimerase